MCGNDMCLVLTSVRMSEGFTQDDTKGFCDGCFETRKDIRVWAACHYQTQ